MLLEDGHVRHDAGIGQRVIHHRPHCRHADMPALLPIRLHGGGRGEHGRDEVHTLGKRLIAPESIHLGKQHRIYNGRGALRPELVTEPRQIFSRPRPLSADRELGLIDVV